MSEYYFSKYIVRSGDRWSIRDDIRLMCSFRTWNLLEPFMGLGPFDIIFCRNVAIYFSQQDRANLFRRLAGVLAKDGWIFAGSSETLCDLGIGWKAEHHCGANCYRPWAYDAVR